MDAKSSTKKTNRRNAESEFSNASDRCVFDSRMGRQTKVVVRREHNDVFAGDADDCALFGLDDGFFLESFCLLEPFQLGSDRFVQCHRLADSMTLVFP